MALSARLMTAWGKEGEINTFTASMFCVSAAQINFFIGLWTRSSLTSRNSVFSLGAQCYLGQLAEKQVFFKSSALTFALKTQQLSGLHNKMRRLTLVALRINVLLYLSLASHTSHLLAPACRHLCSCLEVFLWGSNHTDTRRTSWREANPEPSP